MLTISCCSSKPPHAAIAKSRGTVHSNKPILKALSQLSPHENIYTIPNLLTFSRLIAAPAIGYLVLHDHHVWAVGLFAYAGITDLVDGYIARRWNLQTVVGTVIDPMADKTLMTILTVCLAIKGLLPGETFLSFPDNNLTFLSMAGSNHPRARRGSCNNGHILPMDITSTPKNIQPLLGLFPTLSRSPSDYNQQVQHCVATSLNRCDYRDATADCRRYFSNDGNAVSQHRTLSPSQRNSD